METRAAAVEEEILHKAPVECSYLVLVRGGVCFSLVETRAAAVEEILDKAPVEFSYLVYSLCRCPAP